MATSTSVLWLDANGFQSIKLVRTAASPSALLPLIYGQSNAAPVRYWGSAENTYPSPTPVAATYIGGNWVAELTFRCADLSEAVIRIPAPQVGMFYADQYTVDPSTIGSLIAGAIGTLVSDTGSPASSFTGGHLVKSGG